LAIILGIVLEINKAEWIAIVFCIGMVLALETVNSAIELIVDFISPDFHPIAGKIKDLSAAAVLIISIISAIIGLVIILPYLI
jgi:diacylglycerol kinase (ATP)